MLIRCFNAGESKISPHHWAYNGFPCGYEAHYFQCKVVNKNQKRIWCCTAKRKLVLYSKEKKLVLLSTRENLVLHSKRENWCCTAKRKFGAAEHKRKVSAAQQREIWCCWAEREIWCCRAKRNLVQRAQEKFGAAQYLVQEKKRELVRTKRGSCLWFRVEFSVCAADSKRDYALKPLVHTKIFSPLAPTARQRVRKEWTAQTGCFYFLSPFYKISSPHISTFLHHTLPSFDCIDYLCKSHLCTTFTFVYYLIILLFSSIIVIII